VLGFLYTTGAAIEVMKEQGSGHIVNICSLVGEQSRAKMGVYSRSEFAANAISEAPSGRSFRKTTSG
jgi:NADP-dependent 3-hydroxy acid dehydrogenase YdfG